MKTNFVYALFFWLLFSSVTSLAEPMDLKTSSPEIQAAVSYIDNNSRLNEAFELLNAEKEKDPNNPIIYTQLARYVMRINGRYGDRGMNQARLLLDQALKLNPNRADTYVLLGYVDLEQGKFPEALEKLKKAEELGTTNSWLIVNKARTLHGLGRIQEASELLNNLIHSKPYEDERAVYIAADQLKEFYIEAGFLDKADETYKIRFELSKRKDWLYHDYAVFLLRDRGDFDNAVIYAREALEINQFAVGQRFLAVALSIKAGHEYKVNGDKDYAWKLIKEAERHVGRLDTTLHKVGLFYNNMNAVLTLAEYGVDLNWVLESMENTTFNMLTMRCTPEQLEQLINLGGDIFINPGLGTSLHQVLMNGGSSGADMIAKVKILLKHGAKIDALDRYNRTPLDFAKSMAMGRYGEDERSKAFKEIVALMEAHSVQQESSEIKEGAI